jgi:hypothetical protein
MLLRKCQGKTVPVNATQAHRESWRIAPLITDIVTRWRYVVDFTSPRFYRRGKNPKYPLNMSLGGAQSCSKRHGEAKTLLSLPMI